MRVYSLTEARKILGDLVSRVKYTKKAVALGKHGRADVWIVACGGEEEVPLTEVNAASASFRFLEKEPDLYSREDLRERYV